MFREMKSCVLLVYVALICFYQASAEKVKYSHPTTTLLSDHSYEYGHQSAAATQGETCLATNSWKVSVTDPPNLKLLMMFPEMTSTTEVELVNVFSQIGIESDDFGIALLNDSTGQTVNNIVHAMNHPEDRNRAIVHEWLVGNGLKPVTWYTLMTVLEKIKLRVLADMIRDSVSDCAMNMSSEGTHYSLETLDTIETLKKVYNQEDLLDPNLWLSKHLPNVGYIPLTLEENGRETNLHELLRDLESESVKRIHLTGCPGVGKTTLLNYISKLWAKEGSKFLSMCRILLKIPLGNVGVPIPNDMAQLIKTAFGGDIDTDSLARDLLLNKGNGVCLLLDAYDELKTDNAKRFVRDLLANGTRELHLPEALYIITSRAASSSELTSHTKRTIEVVGISEDELQLFIESLNHINQKKLNHFFNKQPNAWHLCHIPLYLSMVVYTVLADDVIHYAIDTETDLYTSFVNLNLEQYRKKFHPDWNRFSMWKCSSSEESTEKQCKGFQALCSAAFQSILRFRVSVHIDVAQGVLDILQKDQNIKLDEDFIEHAREDLKLVVEIAKDKDESRDVIRFSFDEKSYEEFVQALHLAGLPDGQDTISLHNLVGKGTVIEEHVCTGYSVICSAVNRLMEQRTDGPPINIIETLQEHSLDGRTFGYEPVVTKTLEDLSLTRVTRRPSNYGEVLQFTFPHKTFLEFFCALYMSTLSQDEQLAYIALYANEESFDLVFQFLFGLLRNDDSNISILLERYSAFKSADHRNVVLKLARETKLEGYEFQKLAQESGILVNSSLCIQVRERDDCYSMRYALEHIHVQKLGLRLTLFKSSCVYFTVHSVEEVQLTVNCPSSILSYDHLKRRLSIVEKVVTYLSVKRCLLTPDDVLAFAKQLRTLTKLQTLHLVVTTDITVEGAEALSTALQSLPHLESLQLDMEVMCKGTQALINHLQHLKSLHHLSLTLRSTDEKTLEMISYRRQHSCWKYGQDLHCPYQPFIDRFCCVHNFHRHLQHRGSTSKLATIALSGNCSEEVHTPVKHSFETLGRLENLEALILAVSLDQHSEAAALLGVQGQLSNLKSLDLSYNYVFDQNYNSFVNLHLSQLQFLDIGHTNWKLDNLVELFAFSPNLRTIKLTDSRTHTNVAVESLHLLQHMQYLHAVILDFSDVNDTHIPTLSTYISNMPSLRVLDLACNKITSLGLNVLLGALHHLEHFHHLDLSYNQISSVEIETGLQSLRYLSLADNGMGADGAQSLAATLKHIPSVKHLDLSKNKLTSSGVLQLVRKLCYLHNLQYLDLSYNQLKFDTNQVKELVDGLAKIVTLKYLSLAGNSIPRDSAKIFTNHLTKLHHLDLSDIANQLSLQ